MSDVIEKVKRLLSPIATPRIATLLIVLFLVVNGMLIDNQASEHIAQASLGVRRAHNVFSTINWITGIIFASFTVFLVTATSKRSARAYGVLAICVTLWSFATGLYYSLEDLRILLVLNQFSHYIGAMVGMAFLYFSLVFPEEKRPPRWVLPTMVIIELLLVYPYHFTHLVVDHTFIVQGVGLDRGWILGPLGFIFHINFAVPFGIGLFNLNRKIKRTDDPFIKEQLQAIVLATTLGSLPAVVLNIILPMFGQFYYTWLGPTFSIGWVVATIYAIVRYRALNVKLIVAEIAILIMATILFVNIFFTRTATLSTLGRFAIFIAFAVVGVFFIKSIIKSEKQRDELARITTELRSLNGILEKEVEARSAELEDETHHVEAIIENLTTGLIEYNNDFTVLRINREAEAILGIRRENVVGKKVSPTPQTGGIYSPLAVISFPGLAPESRRVASGTSGIQASINEVRITSPRVAELQVITAPLISGNGTETGFIKVLRDITRERLIARSKSEFISIAAHQLRTPLSIIKWTLSVLLEGDKGDLPAAQIESLSRAYTTNERMIGLVNDLLDVARIEDGRFGYNFEMARIERLVENIMGEYATLAKEKKIAYSLKKDPLGGMPIMFDSTKLSLAIHGILDNAFRYTPVGGTIEIELAYSREHAIITVRDTGIGIPRNQQNRLFTKFFRATNASRMEPDGSGLGLFIVKNIVARHGGKIDVISDEGKGSSFSIKLPLDPSAIPEVEEPR